MLGGTSNSGTIPSVGTPDFSTGPRSKSTTSIWNSSPQRELATNPLSGKLGADHLRPQRLRAISDPDGLQLAPVHRHPHQHTAPPVQVHPDDLPAVICSRHRGPPLPGGDGCFAPSSIRQERRPAPSSHHLACHWLSVSREGRRFASGTS